MMIATSFDEKRKIIYVTRKSTEGRSMLCALVIKGLNNITPVTSRFDFLGRNRDASNPQILESLKNGSEITKSLGDVLEPCLGFCADIEIEKDFSFDCIITYATTKLELERNIENILLTSFYDFMDKTGKNFESKIGESVERFSRYLLPKLIYSPYSQKVLKQIEKLKASIEQNLSGIQLAERITEEKSAFDFSTEYKILYYKFNGDLSRLKQLNSMVEHFIALDIKTMLVVAYDEEDTYFESVRKSLSAILSKITYKLVRYYHNLWRDVSFFEITDNLSIEINEEYYYAEDCPKSIDSHLESELHSEKDLHNVDNIIPKPLESCDAFDEKDDYVLSENNIPALPFSNVICLDRGGTIITENGGGFTFFENSRENKLSEFYQDAVSNISSERLYAIGEGWYSVLNANTKTTYSNGLFKQEFVSKELSAVIEQYLIMEGGTKVIEIKVDRVNRPFNLIFAVDIALGENGKNNVFSTQNYHDTMVFKNLKNNSKMLLRAINGKTYNNGAQLFSRIKNCPISIRNLVDVRDGIAEIVVRSAGTYRFLLGADDYVVLLQQSEFAQEKKLSADYWNELAKIEIKSPQESLNALFNKWLPYQIVSSRFFGRCGFYQTGGAIGFRDQLQDSLAVMKMKPALAREMILNCAKHQYLEGDVMHWWHGDMHGVRTRISDDKLFLPYVVCEYIKWTGDSGILNERLPYLLSKPLESGTSLFDNNSKSFIPRENDRFEIPEVSSENEKLVEHMEKALKSSLKFGKNDLLLIGGGDWNDALNDVGDDENGESVWLSMFACIVLEQMSELYEANSKLSMLEIREKLSQAIEKTYSTDRYKRLITKSGEWLGEKGSPVEIDIVTQSFSSLCGICDKKRVNIALDTAWRELVDEEHGIVKLLSPPIENGYGYISNYPKGVRENGGQYTHASVWYALALLNENRIDEAYEILMMLNPIEKCKNPELAKEYKGEPFVLAGDIYTSPQNYGRAGWSWYTGSAGWYYSTVLKMLGIELRGKALILNPKIPNELDGTVVKLVAYGTTANITIRKKDRVALFLGGTKMSNLNAFELGKSDTLDIEVWCK